MTSRKFNTVILLGFLWLAACTAKPLTVSPISPPVASPSVVPILATRSPTPLPPSPSPPPFTSSPSPVFTPSPTPTPSAGGRTAGDPYAPELGNTGYDVQRYTLQLDLDPSRTIIQGTATIEATSILHNLVQISLDFSGFIIDSLTVDGQPASFSRTDEKLIIDLPQPLLAGDPFTIQVVYRGVPIMEASPFVPFINHLGLQFPTTSNLYAVSQPDGAHHWFPANDHPTDKALFRFEITVPAQFTAVANGTLIETLPSGETTTYIWEHAYPMATYLATVAVGEYEMIEDRSPAGVPIRHYVFPDVRQPFLEAADVTGEALDWMSDLFGPYPFESFGFVTTRIIRASLETQSMVILSENMLNEETVVHEIAHQWFGNWVSMESWADMWSNEGFAVYISLMWQTRENPDSLNVFMQNLRAEVGREASLDPLGDLAPHRLFGFDSYQRGALMIHNLRLLVGDQAFFRGLRLYFERFGGGTASREDFKQVMEEASGMELDDFFTEWLE